jgi:hypothetical protein
VKRARRSRREGRPGRRFVGFSLVDRPTREAPSSGALALQLVRGASPGADDGIRTRDPHLGKVARTGSLTCGDGSIRSMNRAFSFSCNPDGSRRFPVGDGTPTGPLTQTWGYQGTSRTAPKSWTSQKPTSLFDTRGSRGRATQWVVGKGRSQSSPEAHAACVSVRVNRETPRTGGVEGPIGAAISKAPPGFGL